MSIGEFISSTNVDLTNCDREPIHVPGSVQPHGILFVLNQPQLEILQVSDNTANLIGIPAPSLLGKPLVELLGQPQIATIRTCLERQFDTPNPLCLSIHTCNGAVNFNGIVHTSSQNRLILELEPFTAAEISNFFSFYDLTRGTLTKIQQSATLSQLSNLIAQEVRAITGFDRVMVYRFAPDGSGAVIAEDRRDNLEPYLGLRYPATDIPQQARQLYILNPLRLIPDVNYQPVPIISTADPHRPPSSPLSPPDLLDLSLSVLRSVSPIHIEYLKNMGVSASMSISLLKDNQLWGLIACHHQTPKFVSYELRTVCEFLGRVMSLELAAKEENENLDHKIQLKTIQTRFIDEVVRWRGPAGSQLVDGLLHDSTGLLRIVGAEGAAILTDQDLITIGQTPNKPEIRRLLTWLENQFENYLFVTHSLPELYPEAMQFHQVASGLLALSIARIQKNYVLWFRPEVLQYVTWAGNPQKPVRVEADGSSQLFPRQSFAKWQETVRCKSMPWQPYEIEGAVELRSAIVGIVLQKADELATLNRELERSNTELDAFAYIASHDLKEPLRGIHNYSTFLLEDFATVLPADGVEKLETLIQLTKRMEELIDTLLHFSRLGRQDLNKQSVDLDQLVQQVAKVFHISQGTGGIDIRIPQPLPIVQGDPILLEEVLINLIRNALKYNDQADKWVEIGFLPPRNQGFWTFYLRDNGIGIREKHLETIFRIFKRLHEPEKYGGGAGAGLTIVRKIIERHDGKIWVESTVGEGSTFYFTLPE